MTDEDMLASPTPGAVMTSSEVMKWLSISRPTLTAQLQAGELPASRIGSEYRFWRPLLLRRLFGQHEAPEPGPDVITPTDLAKFLRITPATVRARIADGSFPASKIGGTFRIWRPAIIATLEAGEDFRGESPDQES